MLWVPAGGSALLSEVSPPGMGCGFRLQCLTPALSPYPSRVPRGRLLSPLGSHCVHSQSCLTLCDPLDCSPPGSSVHGILQAQILEPVINSFCRGSSRPRP